MPTEITQLPQSDHENFRTYVTPDGYKAAKALVSQTVGTVSCCSVLGMNFKCSLIEGSQKVAVRRIWEFLADIADNRRAMRSIGPNGLFVITKSDVEIAQHWLGGANDSSDNNSQNGESTYFNIEEVNTAWASLKAYSFKAYFFKTRLECAWDKCQAALQCVAADGQISYEK